MQRNVAMRASDVLLLGLNDAQFPEFPNMSQPVHPVVTECSRVNILGVGISAVDLQRAVHSSLSSIASGAKGYICVTGMHGIMEAQLDAGFRAIQNSSFLTIPDGIPTVWIGRSTGHTNMKQVRGADFMLEVCKASADAGVRHFLYGGKPGVAPLLRDILTRRFPGLQIVGTYTPPFRPLTEEEETDLKRVLEEARADVLWCGISTPKQERFMAKYIHTLPVSLMVGVGAAFDLNAGLLQDSPRWVQHCGLQWAHRLYQEPRRLWRRYVLNIPQFVWLYLMQRAGVRAYDLPLIDASSIPEQSASALNQARSEIKEGQLTNIAA